MTTTITTVKIIREVEIEVDVKYTRGNTETFWEPATDTKTFWEPATEDEAEIIEAFDAFGQSIDLTDSEETRVLQMVLEHPPEFAQL